MGFGPRFEIPHKIDGEQFTIIMRGARDGDAEALTDLYGDYQAQQFIMLSGSPTLQDEKDWLETTRVDKGTTAWLISIAQGDNEQLIGATSLHHNRGTYTCHSGIAIADKKWWGKGIASQTHKFRTWYAFKELGYYIINSCYLGGNNASARAMARVGYIELGRCYKKYLTAGVWRDEVLLACYNPLTTSLLWPKGNIEPAVKVGLAKTRRVLREVDAVIQPR